MDKINIWIGLTDKSEEDFYDYFNSEKDTTCGFCLDIGEESYDEDFIGIHYDSENTDLDKIIDETPDSGLYSVLKQICKSKGINKANAMFYYTEDLDIDRSIKYNSLTHIGEFDW